MRRRIDHFDSLSLSAINYLEKHIGVSDIALQGPVECLPSEIEDWERENHPFKLPEDMKQFLSVTNGFYLKWSAWIRGRSLPYGCMHINSVQQIKKIALSNQDTHNYSMDPNQIVAYDLDSKCPSGKVALRYKLNAPQKEPEVWFRDVKGTWYQMCSGTKSFTAYYRLMITHLGIPRWHYAFTDVGLDPLTKFWFGFLAPERLIIDTERDHKKVLAQRQAKTVQRCARMNKRFRPPNANDDDNNILVS